MLGDGDHLDVEPWKNGSELIAACNVVASSADHRP